MFYYRKIVFVVLYHRCHLDKWLSRKAFHEWLLRIANNTKRRRSGNECCMGMFHFCNNSSQEIGNKKSFAFSKLITPTFFTTPVQILLRFQLPRYLHYRSCMTFWLNQRSTKRNSVLLFKSNIWEATNHRMLKIPFSNKL